MEPAIVKAWKVGFYIIPFYFENPLFCILFWLSLLAGMGLQLLLFRKCRCLWARLSLAAGLSVGLLACEVACQMIPGWELYGYLLLWFYLLAALMGAAIFALLHFLVRRG